MDRERILELLRMVLTAFVIAFIIIILIEPLRNNSYFNLFIRQYNNPAILPETTHTETIPTNSENSPNINYFPTNVTEVEIEMSPEKELSGMLKEEILNIRKEEMRTSPIYSRMNYTPAPSVYQIDDGLPWISKYGQMHWSTATDREKIEGVSRDSLGIMNPELLYFVSAVDYYKKNKEAGNWTYLYNTFNLLPYKVIYTPFNKTITAYVRNEKNENGTYFPIALSDSNAHDLGYHYAYMDYSRNIRFYKEHSDNTLENDIKEITGYFMHGSVCGISGGCNNYAPYWQYYNRFYLTKLPAEFNIKLWKNRPTSITQEADINFTMVFE